MNESVSELDRRIARRMIRSLTRGTTISEGARHIHVGHTRWLAAQEELFEETEEDGGSDTKFVRGAYGSGKSHFLAMIQATARERGWVTAHVECKTDEVQIDRFETLYPQIAKKLSLGDVGAGSEDIPVAPIRSLLDLWVAQLLRKAGIRQGGMTKPFDAPERIHIQLEQKLLRSNLPAAFMNALAAYARSVDAGDFETQRAVVDWVQGGGDKIRIPTKYLRRPEIEGPSPSRRSYFSSNKSSFELRPIGTGTAKEALRGLLWLVHQCEFSGLVLCIDEVEELAKLPTQKRRDQALQALREHVDNAGGDSGYRNLCLYLAATPAMFDDEQYFPRYDALQTRIHPVSEEINWRAPVIDLDKTPLTHEEMGQMAHNIVTVYERAYGPVGPAGFQKWFNVFVDEVAKSRFNIAKPRLLARVVVDELERARQNPESGPPEQSSADPAERVRAAAAQTVKDAQS